MAGLETCFGRDPPNRGTRDQEKFKVFERTKQEGRFPLYPVARAEFCYHSLQRTCYYRITVASSRQLPGTRVTPQALNSVTYSEYQRRHIDASDLARNFAHVHPK
jgi:hypothetical protein